MSMAASMSAIVFLDLPRPTLRGLAVGRDANGCNHAVQVTNRIGQADLGQRNQLAVYLLDWSAPMLADGFEPVAIDGECDDERGRHRPLNSCCSWPWLAINQSSICFSQKSRFLPAPMRAHFSLPSFTAR